MYGLVVMLTIPRSKVHLTIPIVVEITDKTQMSGPDLHVFTLKFHSNFSPKKNWFFHFFGLKKKFSKSEYFIGFYI